MKTKDLSSYFFEQRTLKTGRFLKNISFIFIIFSICSCASLNSSNYKSRLRAVNKITDQNILYNVALEDSDYQVKSAAFNKITEQDLINKLAIESTDPKIRLAATGKIADQNILFKVALEDLNYEVKSAAFNKITDQNFINKLAIESIDPKMRLAATNKVTDPDVLYRVVLEDRLEIKVAALAKITDQNVLYKVASGDLDYEIKSAAFNKITDQNLINKLAIESIDSKMRLAAINKATDQNIIYKIALEDNRYEIKLAAMQRLTPGLLAKLASEFKDLNLKLKVIDLLSDQTELMNITQNNANWDVRKAAFKKLDENSLDILTRKAKDPAIILSAEISLGRISWNDAFSRKNGSKGTLGDVIGAAAIIDSPQPTSSDVVSACHNFIQLGDASRIPELINLLNRFGDVTLAEDYMNCGESTLEDAGCNWGRAHGYNCTTGYGSHRVRWGSKR